MYQITGGKAVRLLRDVYPYLVAKRGEADILFALDQINQSTRRHCCGSGNAASFETQQRREELKNRIQSLHHGRSPAPTEAVPVNAPAPTLFDSVTE